MLSLRILRSSKIHHHCHNGLVRARTRLLCCFYCIGKQTLTASPHRLGRITSAPLSSYSFSSTANNNNIITSTSNENRSWMQDEPVKARARHLIHEATYKSYYDFDQALDVLAQFRRDRSTEPETVNLSIQLLERLVKQVSVNKEISQFKRQLVWLADPKVFAPVFTCWKKAAEEDLDDVVSPKELLQKLIDMSKQTPEFRYNIVTFGVILGVAIKQTHRKEAPVVAEELLEMVKQEAIRRKDVNLEPNAVIYGQVLHCWAKSSLDPGTVSTKMDAILQTMRDAKVAPDTVAYTIMLRFWAGQGNVDKVKLLLESMKNEGVKPSMTTLSEALYCYALVNMTERAQDVLRRMIDQREEDNREHVNLIGQGVQNILFSYRRMIVSDTNEVNRASAVESAEWLFTGIGESDIFNEDDVNKLLGTMMDIYACAGSHDRAEAIFDRMKPSTACYNVYLKSLGKQGKAARATAILKDMLENSKVHPDIISFNTVIDGWAEDSSDRDIYHEAEKIFRFMETDPKCKELGIRPDTITFCSLLKVLANSKKTHAGKRAFRLLDEMIHRHKAGFPNVSVPNEIAYKLAFKACVRSDDLERANIVMWRMEESDTPPDVSTYNSFIFQLGRRGEWVATERAEEYLERMKHKAKVEKKPALMPNSETYCLVMDAWARSGHDGSGIRLWMLYEQMNEENVKIDMAINTGLIEALSKTGEEQALKRAQHLLQSMGNTGPDYRHYNSVIKGWLQIGNTDRATKVLMRGLEAYINDRNDQAKIAPPVMDMVMQGWIKADDLQRATSFLEQLQELRDTKRLKEGPDLRMYDTLIGAWRRSLHPEKEKNIETLQKKMNELRIQGVS